MTEEIITTDSEQMNASVFGGLDANVTEIENEYRVRIQPKDSSFSSAISVSGENPEGVAKAVKVVDALCRIFRINGDVTGRDVAYVISLINDGNEDDLSFIDRNTICLTVRGKPISAKTAGQKRYTKLIDENSVIFGIGPAGTGKTFLAVAMAVKALRSKTVSRIVITRPAVEAGERLGYLPGDLQSKIDPYIRPIYDALYEMLGSELCQKHIERGTIEIAPLAYMRGRTLDDSFIILDEAQNTTPEQMKMFLTRLGSNSKAVVTGDTTQSDLPRYARSGLIEALKILDGINGIAVHHFTPRDVVRHRLVQDIINAYDKFERDSHEKIQSDNRKQPDRD